MHTQASIRGAGHHRDHHEALIRRVTQRMLPCIALVLALAALCPPSALATHVLYGWVGNSYKQPLKGVTVLMVNGSNGNVDVTGTTNDSGVFALAVNYGNSFNCTSHYVDLVVDGGRDGGYYDKVRYTGLSLWHTGYFGACYDHNRDMGNIILRDICPPSPPPQIVLPTGSVLGWNNHDVSRDIGFSGRDLGTGVGWYEYQIAEGSPDAWTTDYAMAWIPGISGPRLWEGMNWIRARTVDGDENRSEWSELFPVHIDLTKPITSATPEAVYAPAAVVALSATDNLCVPKTYWRIGETGEWQEGTNVTLPSTPGSVTVYYYSGDLAGNTEEIRSFTVTVEEPAKATVTLKRITSWKTLARNKTYVAKGTVSPAHATDDPNRAEIQAFKRGSNKKFKYVKTFLAKYGATVEGRTAYNARVKLTSRGEWRLRAVHSEDEYGTAAVGTFDYITVK